MSRRRHDLVVRNTRPADFGPIIELTREVYPASPSWTERQLASHLNIFPDGQFVAVLAQEGRVVGMSASLIVLWDDYDMSTSWRDFTDHGLFTNHDPENGRTLYGAEVMVQPSSQGRGVGRALYGARRGLVRRLGLLRIRAGARLRGYHRWADDLTPQEYVRKVIGGELRDPTLSFQLRHGFRVLAVVADYLRHDPDSLGYAAVIEWLNPARIAVDSAVPLNPRFYGEDVPSWERGG
jgi:GNAT superfamily N-acetyltransferase